MQRAGNMFNRIARPILNGWYGANRLTVPRDVYFGQYSHTSTTPRNPLLGFMKPARLAHVWTEPSISREEREEQEERKDHHLWYMLEVRDMGLYITAAFRSCVQNEAYLFMHDEYVRLNYAPGTQDDKVLQGPNFNCKGFPPLEGMEFDCSPGITCAFGSHHGNQAYIFSGSKCALIDYAPGSSSSSDVKILGGGPTYIDIMFPFLKGTEFQDSWHAAFESSTIDEAYIFLGDKYARINYRDGRLISINPTFTCLKNTIFESGIGAAFASHRTDEAYLFKQDSYALINYADDYIIGGVKKIRSHWPSLNSVLPRKNCIVDHDHRGGKNTTKRVGGKKTTKRVGVKAMGNCQLF